MCVKFTPKDVVCSLSSGTRPAMALGGVVGVVDALAEGLRLGRLLDALAGAAVLPAMGEAADLVAFDPTSRELGPPVGAAESDHVGNAGRAPVQREILAGKA